MELKLIQKSEPQRYVLGIVYEPDTVDCQGDYASASDIEKACHDFMKSLQKQTTVAKQITGGILKALADGSEVQVDVTDVFDDIQKGAFGINHVDWSDEHGDIVESYIAPVEFELTDPYGEVQKIKKGTWLMGVILSPENFDKVHKGELTGFSMGGAGVRIPDNVKKKENYTEQIKQFFDDLQEHLLDNADDVPEEVLNETDDDKKKALLLLLLLRGFDFEEKFKPALSRLLTDYANQAVKQAEKEIGFTITAERKKEIIDSIVSDRIAFILPKIEQTTRKMIAEGVYTTNDKNTLKTALNELYAVSDDRAKLIDDVEQRTIANIARVETAKESGLVAAVLVSDGNGCSVCQTINGQIWSLDYAAAHPLEHPNCVRNFSFLSAEELQAYGGIDK